MIPVCKTKINDPANRPDWMGEYIEKMSMAVTLMEKSFEFASIMLVREDLGNIELRNAYTSVKKPLPANGLVFRIFDGSIFHETAVGFLQGVDILKIAQDFVQKVKALGHDGPKLEIEKESPQNFHFPQRGRIDPFGVSTAEKLDLMGTSHKKWSQGRDPRLRAFALLLNERHTDKIYVSRQKILSQSANYCTGYSMFYASDDQGNSCWDSHCFTAEGFENVAYPDDKIAEVEQRILRFLGAPPIEPGLWEIITDPTVSGIIAHEAFGHGVETDMFLKDRALARHFMNKPVGSELVNMYDDPTLIGRMGSYYFDDEGLISSPTTILEKGILKSGLTDAYSAAKLGIKRTANGRRQDVSRKVYARMSNTFFGPGEQSLEELISSVKSGYLLINSGQGMEDPKEWGIQVEARFAEKIENGRLTGKLASGVAITGTVPGILGAVRGMSKDLDFIGGGSCGKGHKEMIPVTCGGPYMLTQARLG